MNRSRKQVATRGFCRLCLAALMLVGCGEEPTQLIDVELNGEGDSDRIPALSTPFAADEIEAMAESFDWSTTTELPEVDGEGRPALHYVLILLRDRSDLEELNLLGLHHDALPLFEAEHERWDGMTGMHAFPGSEAGDFAFALIPAEVYNLFRTLALDGDPVFDAVILREIPVAEARTSEGSLDYDWLGDQGFVYGGSDANAPVDGLGSSTDELSDSSVGRRESMLLGRVIRGARRLVRRAVNGVRRAASEARKGLGGSRTFSLRLFAKNTDDWFDAQPGRNELIRQAWAGPDQGRAVWVRGLEVLVASGAMVSLDRARLDRNGFVRFQVPNARRIRVHIRLKNAAADLVGTLWDKRITVFNGEVDRNSAVHINADVRDRDMNMIAQMTSARDFANEALMYESPRRVRGSLPVFTSTMPTALVKTGAISRVVPNAVAPCLSYYGFGTLSFGSGRGWSIPANLVKLFDEADIWMPPDQGDTLDSRVVATHEYGHYVMCTFLADNSRRAFGRAYSEVWQDTLTGRGEGPSNGQAGIIAEGWADFFSSQAAGGYTRSFLDFGSAKDYESAQRDYYCRPDVDVTSFPCLEDNIGNTSQPFPRGQDAPVSWLGDPRLEDITWITTILTDAFDGNGSRLHNGAVWDFRLDPIDANNVLDVSWRRGAHASDEDVVMPGSGLSDIIRDWSLTSNRFTYSPFLTSTARAMWLNGASAEEICELFALHAPSGRCADLVDAEVGGSVAPLTPFPIEARVFHDSAGIRPRVELTWGDLSTAATGFEASCEGPGGHLETVEVPYARSQSVRFEGLPYDSRLTLSVTTTSDSLRSAPAVDEVWTPSEPVQGAAATPLPGGAELQWDAIEADSVLVRMVAPERRDLATRSLSDSLSLRIEGLAGDAEYTFELLSINGAGELSQYPANVSVRTLPAPELYVATFGDDSDPLAGTPEAPFATVAAALAASDPTMPVTLIMEAGIYPSAALSIENRTVTIEGGYVVDGTAWSRNPDARSELRLGAARSLGSVSTSQFNTGGRSSAAALYSANAVLSMSSVRLVSSSSDLSRCVAALYASDSDVELIEVEVDAAGSGACRVGVEAFGGRLAARNSFFVAQAGSSARTSSDHAGIATDGLADLLIEDSTAVGVNASGTSIGAAMRGVFGLVDAGSTRIRLSRSRFSAAATLFGDISAEFAGGATVAPSTSVWADNSAFSVPGGADEAFALDVASSGNVSIQVFQSTLVVGTRFAPSSRRTTSLRNSVFRIAGRIQLLTMINNLLAFADWGVLPLPATLLDLDGVDPASSLAISAIRGNVFSYPPATTPGYGGGPLMVCAYNGEFSITASTETELNAASRYACRADGVPLVEDNIALVSNPGAGPSSDRKAVVLDDGGDVVQSGSPATGGGTMSLLRDGVPLSAPLPVSEIVRDRMGTMRSASSPGTGAFVL